jgi:anaerobic selenocysteine-containing dehydrogenase
MFNPAFNRLPGSRKKQDQRVKTICRECSVRCGLTAYLSNGAIVDIHGDDDHPVSRGRLCAKGIAFVQGINSPDRIATPAFRKNLEIPFEPWEDWEKALDGYAEHLRKTKDQYGAESIIIGCDPEDDLDFALGAARFADLIGTPHVYAPSDFPPTRSGSSWPPNAVSPCYEWGNSRCLFLIETDLATTHPVAFGWVLEAKQRGAKIIVADTRFTRTMSKADRPLRIKPEQGNLLGLALMKLILENSDFNDDLGKALFIDYEKWKESFENLSGENLITLLGLPSQSLQELNHLLQRNRPITIITGRHLSTLESSGIWAALLAALGRPGIKGSGWYPLDATTPPIDPLQGITGLNPQTLAQETPAYKSLKVFKENYLKDQISARSILCSGDYLGNSFSFLGDSTSEPALMATFGSFPNAAQKMAHWVFPSVLWAEKSGLCFSNDREVYWAEKIVEPKAGCRSGLDFWIGLAKRFGWQDAFPWIKEDGTADHRAFSQWVLESSPVLKGCRLDQLTSSSQSPGSCSWSFRNELEAEGKIKPTPAPEFIEQSSQTVDRECFPLFFQKTSFVSRSGQAGNLWPWTQNLEEEDALQINPQTAKALGIENGDSILISSPGRTIEGRAWISRMVPQWMVSSPMPIEGDWVMVQKKET